MEVEPFIGHASPPEKKEKIRPCPHCGQPMPIKDPWKALFRWPTLNEWITLFIIFMMLVTAWAYKHDVAVCRDYVNNIDSICLQRGNSFVKQPNYTSPQLNITGVFLNNDTNLNLTSPNETQT